MPRESNDSRPDLILVECTYCKIPDARQSHHRRTGNQGMRNVHGHARRTEEGTGTAGTVGTERMAQRWQIDRGEILSVSLPRLDREIYIYISCPSSAPIFLPPSTPRNLVNNFTLLGYISSCNIIRSPFRRFFCHPSSKMPLYNVRDLLASQLGFPHSHAKRTLLF